jgi:hypothetical protein
MLTHESLIHTHGTYIGLYTHEYTHIIICIYKTAISNIIVVWGELQACVWWVSGWAYYIQPSSGAHVCIYECLYAWFSGWIDTYMFSSTHACIFLRAYNPGGMQTGEIGSCIHTCILTCTHTCMYNIDVSRVQAYTTDRQILCNIHKFIHTYNISLQLSRVYKPKRQADGGNLDPVLPWASGNQIVNFDTRFKWVHVWVCLYVCMYSVDVCIFMYVYIYIYIYVQCRTGLQ